MAVLIWHRDAKGDLISRCDAKCYNSLSLKCECICGGLNHGARYFNALEHTAHNMKDLEQQEGVTVASRVKQAWLAFSGTSNPS